MKVLSTVLLLGATAARHNHKAMAAPTFYDDQTAFNTAAGSGLSFESFEDAFSPLQAPSVNFGDFTVTETGSKDNSIARTDPLRSPSDAAAATMEHMHFGI